MRSIVLNTATMLLSDEDLSSPPTTNDINGHNHTTAKRKYEQSQLLSRISKMEHELAIRRARNDRLRELIHLAECRKAFNNNSNNNNASVVSSGQQQSSKKGSSKFHHGYHRFESGPTSLGFAFVHRQCHLDSLIMRNNGLMDEEESYLGSPCKKQRVV